MPFELVSPFSPAGDQPRAIEELTEGLKRGDKYQTLLGATGTGKTLTMAHVIANLGKPALVMSHNKTLAAQLYGELKQFFPATPSSTSSRTTTTTSRKRTSPPRTRTSKRTPRSTRTSSGCGCAPPRASWSATTSSSSLRSRASTGWAIPQEYRKLMLTLETKQEIGRKKILEGLVAIQYSRNDASFERGTFRVRGDTVEIYPAYEEQGVRVELWGDEVERITRFDPLTGDTIAILPRCAIYPAKHFVTQRPTLERAVQRIRAELDERLKELYRDQKLLEAQRLESRTNFDIEMMLEIGTCSGIENYSRHISGRAEGDRPACLYDYFPEDFLVVVDESHVTVPQIGGMFNGDRARKLTLVDHGFRLPSALDNRPLKFDEWETLVPRAVFVSATPGEYELAQAGGVVVEQIIRPTGLIDPQVIVRPVKGQVDDLLAEIRIRAARSERVLVTTLTKRMSEDLTDFLSQAGVRVRYLHSDIESLERVEILRDLRLGKFDVLIGINLLREGLDLPEVSLVAILDADKEGFLRSSSSLIQTVGRAARNVQGTAILYADRITGSMQRMMEETDRRRTLQEEYNREHGIIPQSVIKSIEEIEKSTRVADSRSTKYEAQQQEIQKVAERRAGQGAKKPEEILADIEREMRDAAAQLDFERAALLRDQYLEIKAEMDGARPAPQRRTVSQLRGYG
jgi:excinuclease ABC subunit B